MLLLSDFGHGFGAALVSVISVDRSLCLIESFYIENEFQSILYRHPSMYLWSVHLTAFTSMIRWNIIRRRIAKCKPQRRCHAVREISDRCQCDIWRIRTRSPFRNCSRFSNHSENYIRAYKIIDSWNVLRETKCRYAGGTGGRIAISRDQISRRHGHDQRFELRIFTIGMCKLRRLIFSSTIRKWYLANQSAYIRAKLWESVKNRIAHII